MLGSMLVNTSADGAIAMVGWVHKTDKLGRIKSVFADDHSG